MTRRTPAGLVVVAVVVAVVATLLSACSDGSGSYRLTAWFPRAVSLYEQGDVKVLGLQAGTIGEVEVDGDRVRVELHIDRDVPVPVDVRAMIVPQSLIGERYVQLFPAWRTGQARARDGAVIPLERTSVPVEPDEALAALKEFLDALDPNATGRLVRNVADDLRGNGRHLNDALSGLADLTTTLASKDQELARIIDHLDRFNATLVTRERQLGEVMDDFARTTSLLAEERASVQQLAKGLGELAVNGLSLLTEHRPQLERDITVLTRTLRSVDANFDRVRELLTSLPVTLAGEDLTGRRGLAGAYDPKYHHIDLRSVMTPLLSDLFANLGAPVPGMCLPIDVSCGTPGRQASASPGAAAGGTAATAARPAAPAAPVTRVVPAATRRAAPGAAPRRTSPVVRLARLLAEVVA